MIEETLREHIARSQENLNVIATAAGVDYAALYRFVHEKRKIQLDTVQKLCNYFGLRLTYADSRIVAVLQKVARSLVMNARREFKHRNGRTNSDALREHITAQVALPTFGLDENEQAVAAFYDAMGPDDKARLLRGALTSLALQRQFTKSESETDQDLQEFKDAYQHMDENMRSELEAYLAKAEELQRIEYKLQGSHSIKFRIEVGHSYCDPNTGEELDGHQVKLPAILMRKAMEAWRRGVEFTPCFTDAFN
jgi:hypothetical protein